MSTAENPLMGFDYEDVPPDIPEVSLPVWVRKLSNGERVQTTFRDRDGSEHASVLFCVDTEAGILAAIIVIEEKCPQGLRLALPSWGDRQVLRLTACKKGAPKARA